MTAEDVLEVVGWLETAGIEVWLDGGWGVDALLGHQTRDHDDLDVAVNQQDHARLLQVLAAEGFRVARRDGPFNPVLVDRRGREIDVHLVDLSATGHDAHGVKVYGPHGLAYEVGSLDGHGSVGGRRVSCVTADHQVRSHTRYEIDDDDVRDVLALHRRFGIPLPEVYRGVAAPPPA